MNKRIFFEWIKRNRQYINTAIVLVLCYFVYKRFVNKPVKPKGSDKDVITRDVSGASISDEQAKTSAELLFKAMNYVGGTDEAVIFRILKDLSASDYNKIYNAFGIRYYNTLFGESTLSYFGKPFDLNLWIAHELSHDELLDLKRINPNLPL
ncbi:hypothetical protein [Capnocytophaga canis]|uniref:Annexin n=1 Tax=Capnocytophaga canis TaxID=1848903 RepID=A0A0B7IMQ8_9FLAO|nr:hypothetical protein [Capnocytophaga canis]CEN51909.1 hypothetical protein CCAND93_20035 [Capnocytophaga canis]